MIEALLLNFLFLLFPVLLYVVFFENGIYHDNKVIPIIFSSISMVLCMTFPIKLESGFIVDLRYIPFILIALFGGYKMVFPLYIILNIWRFFIGGAGTIESFVFSTVIFMIVPLISRKFLQLNTQKRISCAVLVSICTSIFYLSTLSSFFHELTTEYWLLSFYTLTTHAIVIFMIMILIERIISNVKSRERFLHSERLNVIGELSASVAHEIRNPLTVTNGFLQLLNESSTITSEERMYIDFSLKELERAEKIVSDYLAFAKPQSANMIYSNFKDEIEYAKNILIPYANMNQVNIQSRFQNSLNKNYDKYQIRQCFINLFKNGIEAMKESGGTLNIDIWDENKKIFFKITDTGIGMTSKEVAYLGKPYFSNKIEGTGLGMLMVYGTINEMKGEIEVESEKGKGTTFVITIPV
ncbi:ATP-binding protein [Bacillus sp. FJAT-50079]|uniref:ATP-binding protein n=1 Tax=Bacillus sp. FJAT-50079 TaxID=2833577 RepID=UPI001BCA32E1|nr:ATP-binding protein [Bacillus sp. FJAT-50079]MBS4207922.1 two-component sensor histidine kinase [Bacillus sp. FJAT-50079]